MKETIKVYIPLPYREGNKVVKKYDLPFDDGAGHTANITYVDWRDSKNRLHERYVMYINWNK